MTVIVSLRVGLVRSATHRLSRLHAHMNVLVRVVCLSMCNVFDDGCRLNAVCQYDYGIRSEKVPHTVYEYTPKNIILF